jgi:hypothetical protein
MGSVFIDINSAFMIVANASCTTCAQAGMEVFYDSTDVESHYYPAVWKNTSYIPLDGRMTEGFAANVILAEEIWEIDSASSSTSTDVDYHNTAWMNH